jgi:hypothetical protein
VADLIRFQNAGRSRSDAEFVHARYLVASRGELVVRFAPNPGASSSFKVFRMLQQWTAKGKDDNKEEADVLMESWCWSEQRAASSELDTLGGWNCMLFVGRACSRSYEVISIRGYERCLLLGCRVSRASTLVLSHRSSHALTCNIGSTQQSSCTMSCLISHLVE